MPGLSEVEARRRFGGARVARLATVGPEGRPRLVPVVFALCRYDGADLIVTAVDHKPKTTTHLRRLTDITAHPAVSLLADDYEEDWDRLWWARADGDARVLPTGEVELRGIALGELCRKYPQYRQHPPEGAVIAVSVRRWTGWTARRAD
ncbi:TIGR03668 family PPOX class F420-dependent oxidoreductase [Streptomyces sp. J2-1]|uniref:TIGR03668 family PPOX class F420-dependent oxidoreductase n=1 Tax=Streptomyces corallincola TaxID=2851888 RepID=UPI001C3808ED|nr:TIGR03668 family PPOX class F420-dependent oxidoreductase [Streptomyces corallincola]MBV2355719.1 TIGR03668 family PPOX class F420-dependent oxidoreductase [Streptomyces corallincola]